MAQPLFPNLKQVLPVGEWLGFVLVDLKWRYAQLCFNHFHLSSFSFMDG
jgi:hypothetical protein